MCWVTIIQWSETTTLTVYILSPPPLPPISSPIFSTAGKQEAKKVTRCKCEMSIAFLIYFQPLYLWMFAILLTCSFKFMNPSKLATPGIISSFVWSIITPGALFWPLYGNREHTVLTFENTTFHLFEINSRNKAPELSMPIKKCLRIPDRYYTPGQPCLTVTSECILDHKMRSFCIYKQQKRTRILCYGEWHFP